jgi:hypothetical protein
VGALLLTWVTSTIACARLLATVPSLTTTSMMRVSVEGLVPVLSNLICSSAA